MDEYEGYQMTKTHKNILSKNEVYLLDHVPVDDPIFLADLKAKCTTFRPNDIATIKAEKTPQERCSKLLELLPKKGPDAFKYFLEALKANDVEFVAKKLERDEKGLSLAKLSLSDAGPSSPISPPSTPVQFPPNRPITNQPNSPTAFQTSSPTAYPPNSPIYPPNSPSSFQPNSPTSPSPSMTVKGPSYPVEETTQPPGPTNEWTRAVAFLDKGHVIQIGLWGAVTIASITGAQLQLPPLPALTDIWHVSTCPKEGIVAMVDRGKNMLHVCMKNRHTWVSHKISSLGTPSRVAITPSGKYIYTLDDVESKYNLTKYRVDENVAGAVDVVWCKDLKYKSLSDICAMYDDTVAILTSDLTHAEIHIFSGEHDSTTITLEIEDNIHGNRASRAALLEEYTTLCTEESGQFLLAKRAGLVSLMAGDGSHVRDILPRQQLGTITCINIHGDLLALSGEKGVIIKNMKNL